MEFQSICKARKLPAIWQEPQKDWPSRRQEILALLQQEEYGFFPEQAEQVTFEVLQEEKNFCAGKVTLSRVKITARWKDKVFSFPIRVSVPNAPGKHPFFVHINFRPDVPDRYLPIEEICDRGFAVLSVYYEDVTPDGWPRRYVNEPEGSIRPVRKADGSEVPCAYEGVNPDDLYEVLFGILPCADAAAKPSMCKLGSESINPTRCGKIALWAWAASRAMDYAETLENLDMEKSAVIGHSRLGKTALLAGALDERFRYIISNDSGCSGAAVSRGKGGESIERITNRFGYWFCDDYKKYSGKEDSLPFDQHFLLAASAPRKVYVASAVEDTWADPDSEYLSCFGASEVYEKLGMEGLVGPDRLPGPGDVYHGGNVGYHLRKGTHYLSREDWKYFMDFMLG